MRTMFVAAAVAAAMAATVVQAADGKGLTNASVRATSEPFQETVFGLSLSDPYRWMERADRASDVDSFIRTSSAHTVGQLAALPGRARLREKLAAAMAAGVSYAEVQSAGDKLFYRRLDPSAQLEKLVMRDAAGVERILYDPEAGGTKGPAINNYNVSPDGKLVAMHTAPGGSEIGSIAFIDTASGQQLPDKLAPALGELRAEWLDNRTVAYTRLPTVPKGSDMFQNMQVFVHRLGGTDSRAVLGTEAADAPQFQPQEFVGVEVSETSDWVIGKGGGARPEERTFVIRRKDLTEGRMTWREIANYSDQVRGSAVSGDRLYLLSTQDAPNGKVLLVDLSNPAATPIEVLSEGDSVLLRLQPTKSGLYIFGQTDGINRLFFLANGTRKPVEIALPIQGRARGYATATDGQSIIFSLSDWFTAPRYFTARGADVTPLGLAGTSYSKMAQARQIREEAISADGTRVPMAILTNTGSSSERPRPLLLEGYGSYGLNTAEPRYAAQYFALLEEGGIVAFCGTRGGGERGRMWHEGGRSANKPNAHADLVACGERLVELGLTRPDMMTVSGYSAGGMLAPPAALKRPDLYAGLIANAGLLNSTRLPVAVNGPNQYAEQGDATTEAGFKALLLSDSYQMLSSATHMPDTLLIVGLNDSRVSPWMSAKFAARALDRFGDRRLVLVRTDPDAGHGFGSAKQQLIEQYADMWSFILNRAGVKDFTPQ